MDDREFGLVMLSIVCVSLGGVPLAFALVHEMFALAFIIFGIMCVALSFLAVNATTPARKE